MNSIESSCISVPLGREAHATARQFAVNTPPQRGKQVYLNTLAVYAVHYYLNWLQVESDLGQSDSWNPGIQSLSDVADLVLPSIGCLECRSVLPGETSLIIPPQATENRLGYVAVRLNKSLDKGVLLGFLGAITPANQPQQIPLAHLQPLDVLLDRLPVISQGAGSTTGKVTTNLSRWLENIFEVGWLTVEDLLSIQAANPVQLRMNTDIPATEVKRGKLIDLGIQLAGQRVALIVTCQPADEEIEIRLQVYPADRSIYLPPIQLVVLDENGNTVPELQVLARSADNCIQLEFTGKPGEQFSVKLALGDVSITEYFQI